MLDHEIGTHFAIAANDAAQGDALRDAGAAFGGGPGGVDDVRAHANANGFPSHKAKSRGFGVSGAATPRERLVTEEGLATLNTHRCAGVKILYGPALAYWTRWHASKLTFCELFEKLEEHVPSANARWTQCVRSKRGLVETKQRKACAKDQCYFEGAVRLLEARRLLDFKLLHGGKIALEEYADAKQAMLRHSQRRGKIARRLGALSKGETASRPASALLSRRDRDATRDRDPDDALDAPNYLRGIRGGVSSASLVDAVASALRSQSLMETSASRVRAAFPGGRGAVPRRAGRARRGERHRGQGRRRDARHRGLGAEAGHAAVGEGRLEPSGGRGGRRFTKKKPSRERFGRGRRRSRRRGRRGRRGRRRLRLRGGGVKRRSVAFVFCVLRMITESWNHHRIAFVDDSRQ